MIFRTKYKYFKYQIMLFRLINALTTCQKLFNQIFEKALNDFTIIYLNDILIYSKKNKKIYQAHPIHFPKITRTQSTSKTKEMFFP